jgi:hypothetical protein
MSAEIIRLLMATWLSCMREPVSVDTRTDLLLGLCPKDSHTHNRLQLLIIRHGIGYEITYQRPFWKRFDRYSAGN